jgi:hypothetical protein
MFNNTNYAAGIRSGISQGQSGIAKANKSYLESLASGEGSLQMGRHQVQVEMMNTASLRQNESFTNEQAKADLQANKASLDAFVKSQAA